MGHKTPLYRIHKGKRAISAWPVEQSSYSKNVLRDYKIRKYVNDLSREHVLEITDTSISSDSEIISIDIHSAKPGAVLGKNGTNVELIRKKISEISGFPESKIDIQIIPIADPEVNAMIIAMRIARGLQTRKNCNSTMRTHMQDAVRRGVNGIKILCSGRLNGAEIASSTSSYHGKVPKHTIRANISYAVYEANTSSGKCGIKVWVNNAKNLISVKSNPEDSKNLKNSNNFRGSYSFRSTNNVQSTRGAKS